MKNFLLLITLLISAKTYAQVEDKNRDAVKDKATLSPAARIIFMKVKTKMSNEEKNFFSQGVFVQSGDKSLLTVDPNGEDQGVLDVEIYPTDLNKDGNEEIFTRTSGTFFGQWLQELSLYIKNKSGQYVIQKDVSAPRFYARWPGVGGYPDLVGGAPEGPGFNNPKGPINMYRWDGNTYKLFKKNQVNLKTDKSIEDIMSPEYAKTLPAVAAATSSAPGNQSATLPAATPTNATGEPTTLNPLAIMLFRNVKSKLSDNEKNELALKTGITAADTLAKTKKGKPKIMFTIYPTDLNKDGTEEIFLCSTTSPLGIPIKNFYFFAKDLTGKYQPLPGKIGRGAKIILNGKAGYPDLINLSGEMWSWDGRAYHLRQKINNNVNLPYKTEDIDDVSLKYTGKK